MNNLTVGILSYNRPYQLARCLNSLLPLPDGVKVLIHDDCSPKIHEIQSSIRSILDNNPNMEFCVNTVNVGYDQNLLEVIVRSQTSHVLLLGDDDMLEPGAIQNVLVYLKDNNPRVGFLRSRFSPELMARIGVKEVKFHRNSENSKYYPPSVVKANGSYLYNSILFSGLLFDRAAVIEVSRTLSSYKNSIYIQVAIFCLLSCRHGGYFISGPGVMIGSDGENGFGLNASSKNESDLADRSSVASKLKFQRRLIKVVEDLGLLIGDEFVASFYREYNFRNLSGMREARGHGRSLLAEYWLELSLLTKNQSIAYRLAFYIMWALPNCVNEYLLELAETLVRKYRYHRTNS